MTMIQVRNVPDGLHRALKVRAAKEGMTLSDFALKELRRAVATPSPSEMSERLQARTPQPYNGETAAESTRAERDLR